MQDRGVHIPAHTALGLGISAPHPQISEFFVWDWEGAQTCFILRNQTTGDLTFTSPGHTHSPVCAPTASFSFSRVDMWVICYHISNHSQLCITVYTYSQYHIFSCVIFFGHSQSLQGGGGGGGGGGAKNIFCTVVCFCCLLKFI